MYAAVGALPGSLAPKYRWFFIWDHFYKKWDGPHLMSGWDANKKIEWWRDSHPDYYSVHTGLVLEDPYMVYWRPETRTWQRYCSKVGTQPFGLTTADCVSEIV